MLVSSAMRSDAIDSPSSITRRGLISARPRRPWLLIVAALLEGPKRFNELQDELDGIAPNVLSARLKALTEQALVVAQPYSERPPRFAYELSEAGRELAGALRLLADWGARHRDDVDAPRHSACGTPLEAVWYCPTCDQLVDHEPDHTQAHFV